METRKYYPGFKACCRIRSERSGIRPVFSIRSVRYCQNDTPNFRQVFFKLVNVSRHCRPDSLRVLPLILRFLTYSRIAFSAQLLCKGISGRSKTMSNSDLLQKIRPRAVFNVALAVFCVNMWSKKVSRRFFLAAEGFSLYFFNPS